MSNAGKQLSVVAAIAFLVLVAGCTSQNTSAPEQTPFVITVAKGLVTGASVNVYALNDDGTKGQLLAGPFISDSSGNVNLFLPLSLPPVMLVESVGGAYKDEATGLTVQLSGNDIMRAVLASGSTQASVTPFTHMATALAMSQIKKGTAAADAVNFANTVVSQQYNIRSILDVAPADANDRYSVIVADREQREYGVLLAGLAQQAKDIDVRSADLEDALAKDWSDGIVDGKEEGNPIIMEDSNGRMVDVSASTGLEGLQAGVDKFRESGKDATKMKYFSIAVKPVSADPRFYIETPTLYVWVAGQSNSFQLATKGGVSPYRWALKQGSTLPDGFALNAGGVLSGTAPLLLPGTTERITTPFTVVVTDSNGQTRELELRITIMELVPVITTVQAECVENSNCNVKIATADGGSSPYYFKSGSFRSGTPPFGIGVGLDGSTTGKSKKAGTYTFEVCVVDSVGGSSCKPATLTITPEAPAEPVADQVPVEPVRASKTYDITINFDGTGTGGVVLVTAEGGIDGAEYCVSPSSCVFTYNDSQVVGLGNAPDEDSVFSEWSGGCTPVGNACRATMDSDKQVTAKFEKKPENPKHTLTVVKTGSGTGYVNNPPNFEISCGTKCSAEFSYDSSDNSIGANLVTLFATPDADSTLAQWSGEACDFINYKPTDPACWIRNMTKDETVTVQFDKIPVRVTPTASITSTSCSVVSRQTEFDSANNRNLEYITWQFSAAGTATAYENYEMDLGIGSGKLTWTLNSGDWSPVDGVSTGTSSRTPSIVRKPGQPETTTWSITITYEPSYSYTSTGPFDFGIRAESVSKLQKCQA